MNIWRKNSWHSLFPLNIYMEDSVNLYLKDPLTLRDSCLQRMANPIDLILGHEYTHKHTNFKGLNQIGTRGFPISNMPFKDGPTNWAIIYAFLLL